MKLNIQTITRCLVALCMAAVLATDAYAQTGKMSSFVRQRLLLSEGRHAIGNIRAGKASAARPAAEGRRMTAFVRTSDLGVLRSNDCHVLASFGDIHIASIPMHRLRQLAASDAVKRIEAGRSCTALMDSAVIVSNVHRMWGQGALLPTDVPSGNALRGSGTVVGVMDIGFDLTFPGYYSSDGERYRVKALWDMLDRTGGGAPVSGTDTTYVGRQYVGQEQLLALRHSYDGHIVMHGTHTSNIAAGCGATFVPAAREALRQALPYGIDEQLFSGIAPDADICLVANATSNNSDSIPEEMDDMYNTALDVLGFKYIFDYADAQHKPCVISFSEGSRPDMYGDDQLYAEALNSMLGPGRILCAAAGNEGHRNTYVHKPVGMATGGAFTASATGHVSYMMRSSDKMTLRVGFYLDNKLVDERDYTTDQCLYDEDEGEVFSDTIIANGREFVVLMASYPSCYDETEWATELVILATDGKTMGRDVPIALTLVGEDVDCEIFSHGGYFKTHEANPALNNIELTHNVHSPGGLPGIICVGSTNSRKYFYSMHDKEITTMNWGTMGERSLFSSVGPSMCRQPKPDVAAPGCFVVSAGNSFYHEHITDLWDCSTFDWNGRTYVWHAECGTSMACPVVAGIIATWLQVCPALTPQQAMEAIAATAVKSPDFYSYPNETDERGFTRNNYLGYGVIDAYAGLQYVLNNFTGISEVTAGTQDPAPVTYDLMGRRVSTMLPGNIYIRGGKKIIQTQK